MKYFLFLALLFAHQLIFAKSVEVKGYYRKNGTYVQPHIRSSPDSNKWNNYGSSGSGSKSTFENRDADKDGTPNYKDNDDDNDGVLDDNE